MRPGYMQYFTLAALLLSSGCSGNSTVPPEPQPATEVAAEWPIALPQDSVKPGDVLNSAGKVIPQRSALSFDTASEFTRGADFDTAGGNVLQSSQGAHFSSGSLGSKQLSYALYRIPLAGDEPGAVAVDANLNAVSGDGDPSSYYIGLSDYSQQHWEWHGPYSDSHVRISSAEGIRAGRSYVSSLGNLYVAVIAFDGAAFDLVGVGTAAYDSLDSSAPPAPAALGVTASAGSFLVEWTPSAAADLAGYRLYYSDSSFSSSTDPGVESLDYLEGAAQHVLAQPPNGAGCQ